MPKSYVLKGTQGEYLLVIKTEDEKVVHKIIDILSSSRTAFIKDLAADLEKSLHDSGRDISKAGPKNKSKGPVSNKGGRRKTKDA